MITYNQIIKNGHFQIGFKKPLMEIWKVNNFTYLIKKKNGRHQVKLINGATALDYVLWWVRNFSLVYHVSVFNK